MASSPRGTQVYHGGNNAGFRARMVRYPEHRASVVCLCNLATIATDPLPFEPDAAGDREA